MWKLLTWSRCWRSRGMITRLQWNNWNSWNKISINWMLINSRLGLLSFYCMIKSYPTLILYSCGGAIRQRQAQNARLKICNRIMCLFMPQLSMVLVMLPMEGWPGWVDLRDLLYTDMVICPQTIIYWSTTQTQLSRHRVVKPSHHFCFVL